MRCRCSAPNRHGARALLAGGGHRPWLQRRGSRQNLTRRKVCWPPRRAQQCALDLFTELGRRAERLIAVAPKLRAKGADRVVEKLLSDDALVASRGDKKTGMSDRGLRSLFDRLVELGAVRELSGRTTFRIYGL
ncbi:DUF1403 family protein [Mesorhizobium sp. AR07]|uniref:DUF1403 family protein n=1 Tax=Mesorhizobium sp. AR07 TaxID=2865838 RepID=UPI0039B6F8C3